MCSVRCFVCATTRRIVKFALLRQCWINFSPTTMPTAALRTPTVAMMRCWTLTISPTVRIPTCSSRTTRLPPPFFLRHRLPSWSQPMRVRSSARSMVSQRLVPCGRRSWLMRRVRLFSRLATFGSPSPPCWAWPQPPPLGRTLARHCLTPFTSSGEPLSRWFSRHSSFRMSTSGIPVCLV